MTSIANAKTKKFVWTNAYIATPMPGNANAK